MGDTVISAKGLLMPNLRPKPSPHPKLMLKLHHGVDTTVDTTVVDTDTVDTDMDTVISARGLLMLNPKLRLRLHHGADTTVVDTTVVDTTDTVDTVDTDGVVKVTTVKMDTSG